MEQLMKQWLYLLLEESNTDAGAAAVDSDHHRGPVWWQRGTVPFTSLAQLANASVPGADL